jgi:hypothetical protein
MNEEEYGVVSFDLEEDEKPALYALGMRLAILQGIYDVTYEEIAKCVEEKYKDKRAYVTEEELGG